MPLRVAYQRKLNFLRLPPTKTPLIAPPLKIRSVSCCLDFLYIHAVFQRFKDNRQEIQATQRNWSNIHRLQIENRSGIGTHTQERDP